MGRCTLLQVLTVAVANCTAPVGNEEAEENVGSIAQASVFLPMDDRVRVPWTMPVAAPLTGIGLVQSPAGSCTGTLIAGNKVLTAYHCTFSKDQGELPANQFTFTLHGSSTATKVTRIVHGRECCGAPSDFALMTLDTNLATPGRVMAVRGQEPTLPLTMDDAGYSGDLGPQTLGVHIGCNLTKKVFDGALGIGYYYLSDCDYTQGASGGPVYRVDAFGTPIVAGLNSGGGGDVLQKPYSDGEANLVTPSLYFANAPDNAVGISMTYTATGRMHVYATDKDWTLIADRVKDSDDSNATWTAWNGYPLSGRKIAATNLQDNRQAVYVLTPTGAILENWEKTLGGSWQTSWKTLAKPTTPIKDIAATGSNGRATQLFALGTDNTIYSSYKTGGANSAWSSWCTLGSVPDAVALAAVDFKNEAGANIRQIFVASTSAGVRTAWSSQSDCSTWNSLRSFGDAPMREVAVGRLKDGRLHTWGVTTAGVLQDRIRSNNAWSDWTNFQLQSPNPLGFSEIASGTLSDGREQVFGISDGEITTTIELLSGAFPVWARFYI